MKKLIAVLRFIFPPDAILCTAFVFVLMAGIEKLFDNVTVLNPLELALSDFEMMDMVYATGMKDTLQRPATDTSIILVNIGDGGRYQIGKQLERIAAEKPLAVAIDASFLGDRKPEDDSVLEAAMKKIPNLVLYSMLRSKDNGLYGGFDSLELCNPRFARHGTPGYVNMYTEGFGKEAFRICRRFHPSDTVNGRKLLPISLQTAWFADSNKVKKFLSRRNHLEIINYAGNIGNFQFLDVKDIFGQDESGFRNEDDTDLSIFRNKLVFMGYMGSTMDQNDQQKTLEDKFYTPLNENFAGKSYPDMFGVVIHANIANMVLQDKPLDEIPEKGHKLIAIVLCYLNVLGFFFIHRNHPGWYDLSVKAIQIFEVFLILWVALMIYSYFDYKADLSLAAFAVGLAGDVLEVYVGIRDKILGWIRPKKTRAY